MEMRGEYNSLASFGGRYYTAVRLENVHLLHVPSESLYARERRHGLLRATAAPPLALKLYIYKTQIAVLLSVYPSRNIGGCFSSR